MAERGEQKTVTSLQAPIHPIGPRRIHTSSPNQNSPAGMAVTPHLPLSHSPLINRSETVGEQNQNQNQNLQLQSPDFRRQIPAMEVSGVVFRPLPCYSGAGFRQTQSKEPTKLSVLRATTSSSEFSDDGHLRYYRGGVVVCKKKKEKMKAKDAGEAGAVSLKKKKMKMIKGLRDLSAFAPLMNLGHDEGKMISGAAEALLAQLQELRAEEKEKKRRRKAEKAALKAAAQMKAIAADGNTSSSSSSESSEGECGEVVDMSGLRSEGTLLPQLKIDQPQSIQMKPSMDTSTQADNITSAHPCSSSSTEEWNSTQLIKSPRFSTCCDGRGGSNITSSSGKSLVVVGASPSSSERIEVCMGGKCKKSGAVLLMEEFERMIGVEGAVVGCKCMGKCRDGPNVRVLKDGWGSISPVTNPLCIGVGLEDVGTIVASFFGEKKDMGLIAA